MTSTIDPKEIEKFTKMAVEWWSETGKFKPLHKFNPIRISHLRQKIIQHFSLEEKSLTPFKNLNILDVGCGGGLISEPFARMGASVTGIDAGEKNIAVAKIHAEKSGLEINYQNISAEELVEENQKFDVVFALEIIEHVADVEAFIEACSKLVKPNGLLFVATINRNLKSLALAKVAVEYILRWLPAGTHDWKKFLKPSEINNFAEKENLELCEILGFNYNILKDEWRKSDNLDINYMMIFKRRS
jgi:2-polyprenyl-6-hydroxyphenyl methylase/3-demethylubiquinone-9 3-methyltransferase